MQQPRLYPELVYQLDQNRNKTYIVDLFCDEYHGGICRIGVAESKDKAKAYARAAKRLRKMAKELDAKAEAETT